MICLVCYEINKSERQNDTLELSIERGREREREKRGEGEGIK